MMLSFAFIFAFPGLSEGLRLNLKGRSVEVEDISNCTWTDWSVCRLETETRCSRTRTLELLPMENQTAAIESKVLCNGQAGRTDSVDCDDELCPVWKAGNWTDCSQTCGQQLEPWVGYQNRNVTCLDTQGTLYRRSVCGQIRGMEPIDERPCECSHTVAPFDPYQVRYTPVDN